MTIPEPHHDATIVDLAEYWQAIWKARAAAPVQAAASQSERLTADYQREVAKATAALWGLRANQERALASARDAADKPKNWAARMSGTFDPLHAAQNSIPAPRIVIDGEAP